MENSENKEKPTPFLKRVAELEKHVYLLDEKLERVIKSLKGRK